MRTITLTEDEATRLGVLMMQIVEGVSVWLPSRVEIAKAILPKLQTDEVADG